MNRLLFGDYKSAITRHGVRDQLSPMLTVARDQKYFLQYTPFEFVNVRARLTIVGITPGPNQLDIAYARSACLIARGDTDEQVLRDVVKEAAFGGATVRPNLIRMLKYLGIGRLLGIDDEAQLWGTRSELLYSTSIVPHAAFKLDGKKFSGPFDQVLASAVLRECFEDCFISVLKDLSADTLYLGLGPVVEQGLAYCVNHGHLKVDQVLGALPHPSTESGSQVDIFLETKSRATLSPRDPVRNRVDWIEQARHALKDRVSQISVSGKIKT